MIVARLNDEYARRNLLFQIKELERNEFWNRFPVCARLDFNLMIKTKYD
jgi:hypothetical protein